MCTQTHARTEHWREGGNNLILNNTIFNTEPEKVKWGGEEGGAGKLEEWGAYVAWV